mmetsp:Transcript_11976/g.37908  ORF Transcript_11976/g.37908 Transcript_11976/m.37908 type:complete len:270 (+) Transcript_11976:352-1161(+)
MSRIDAPFAAITALRPAMPPGRSEMVATNLTIRPSAARPRSSTRPSTVVSMLPPQSGSTMRLPCTRSCRGPPGSTAARPTAPPPSMTIFSVSISLSIAMAICRSFTETVSLTMSLATSNALAPTFGTARPSASVGRVGVSTGVPARRAAWKEAQRSGSTPSTWQLGRTVLSASATPAISPAPPTGTMQKSMSSTCSSTSRPSVPAPAMMSGWSKPLRYSHPSNSGVCECWYASRMCAPCTITFAPSWRQRPTFASGASVGITTVIGSES